MTSKRSVAPPARVPVASAHRVCRRARSRRCRRARAGRQAVLSGHAHHRRPVRRGRAVAAYVVRTQDARERRRAACARDGVLGRRHEARDREFRHRLRRKLRQGAAGRSRDRARFRQPRARSQVSVLPGRRARIDPVRGCRLGHRRQRLEARGRRAVQHDHAGALLRQRLRRPSAGSALPAPARVDRATRRRLSDAVPHDDDRTATAKRRSSAIRTSCSGASRSNTASRTCSRTCRMSGSPRRSTG